MEEDLSSLDLSPLTSKLESGAVQWCTKRGGSEIELPLEYLCAVGLQATDSGAHAHATSPVRRMDID